MATAEKTLSDKLIEKGFSNGEKNERKNSIINLLSFCIPIENILIKYPEYTKEQIINIKNENKL